MLKTPDEFVAHRTKDAERNHRPAVDLSRQVSECERRSAEPAKLLAQGLDGERLPPRFGARLARAHAAGQTGLGGRIDRQGAADSRPDDQIDRRSPLRIS